MKRCKLCGRRLKYAAVQSEGRVSTYECKKCKRTVDIPFKPEGDYKEKEKQAYHKEVAMAKWFLQKMGSLDHAILRLQRADEVVKKQGFKPKELK